MEPFELVLRAQVNGKEDHQVPEGELVGVIARRLHFAIDELKGL
jgi:hypothetical protein